jgi:phage terminase small subunit
MTEEITDGSEPLKGRQETFCQLYATGVMSASEAYRRAGYSEISADTASSRLSVKVGIKARIAYIKAEWARIHKVDKETQTVKLHKALQMAEQQSNPQAMVKAIEATNRMYGLDKQVVVNEDLGQLTAEEEAYHREYAAWRLDQERKANIKKIG